MRRGGVAKLLEEFFRISVRLAHIRCRRPRGDFGGGVLVALVRRDPREDFAVALSLRELGAQRFRVGAEIFEYAPIERAVVVILAALAGDLRAAFVEHAR